MAQVLAIKGRPSYCVVTLSEADLRHGSGDASPLPNDRTLPRGFSKRSVQAHRAWRPCIAENPLLTVSERAEWEGRLTALYNECGCHAGAIGLLAAFPILAVLFSVGSASVARLDFLGVGLVVALPLAGGVVGKSIGVVVGRLRLRRALRELRALLEARETAAACRS